MWSAFASAANTVAVYVSAASPRAPSGNAASGIRKRTPAGNTKEVQFNNAGSFGSNSNFVFDLAFTSLGLATTAGSSYRFNSAADGGAVYAASSGAAASPTSGIANIAATALNGGDGYGTYYYLVPKNTAGNSQRTYIGAVSNTGAGAYTSSIVIGQQTGATAYAERMRIDASGNVGIGTTSPAALLHVGNGGATKMAVHSTANDFGQLQIGNPTANAEASLGFVSGVSTFGSPPTSSGGDQNIWGIGAGLWASGGNKFGIGNRAYGGAVMTLTHLGNVGIGTTNPTQKLQVAGGANGFMVSTTDYASGSVGSAIKIGPILGTGDSDMAIQSYKTGATAYSDLYIQSNGGNAKIGGGAVPTEKFEVNGNMKATNIYATGNVGIGTTSPGGKVDVNQTTAGSMTFQGQNAGTAFWKILNPAGGATNTWNAANAIEYVGKDTGTNRSINAAGTVNASGADFAEWIDWSGEKPAMGSVVFYRGSYVVVSSPHTAAFIGNDIKDPEHSILIAFAGQLPVRVRGVVREGDLIVANDDGTSRAVPKALATV